MQEKNESEAIPPTESDLKMFVLYLSATNRDELSVKALEALAKNPKFKLHTRIQNVEDLKEKPQWMKTFPMLVVKEEKKAYGGQECISFITNYKKIADQRRAGIASGRRQTNPW